MTRRRRRAPAVGLRELQEQFWKSLHDEAAPQSSGARTGIYAEMHFERCVEALRSQFPQLRALVGPAAFDVLATDYVKEHPSTHYSLARLGERLARQLASSRIARPDAADLAALEWARCDVRLERDDVAASLKVLSGASARTLERLRLRAVASARLLELDHDVLALWQALADGEDAPPPSTSGVTVVVWRVDGEAAHDRVEPHERTALRRLFAGASLGRISAAFGEKRGALDLAEAALVRWFDAGWVATA